MSILGFSFQHRTLNYLLFLFLNTNFLVTGTRPHPSGLVLIDLSASCGTVCPLNSRHRPLSCYCPLLLIIFALAIPSVWNTPPLSTPSACLSVHGLLLVICSYVVNDHPTESLKTKILFARSFFGLRIWEQLKWVFQFKVS